MFSNYKYFHFAITIDIHLEYQNLQRKKHLGKAKLSLTFWEHPTHNYNYHYCLLSIYFIFIFVSHIFLYNVSQSPNVPTFLSRSKGINSETLYHVLSAKGNRINILSWRVRVQSQAIAHKLVPDSSQNCKIPTPTKMQMLFPSQLYPINKREVQMSFTFKVWMEMINSYEGGFLPLYNCIFRFTLAFGLIQSLWCLHLDIPFWTCISKPPLVSMSCLSLLPPWVLCMFRLINFHWITQSNSFAKSNWQKDLCGFNVLMKLCSWRGYRWSVYGENSGNP